MASQRLQQETRQQEAAHQTILTHVANSNSALILAEQCKRLALEQWLAASDQAHYRALTDTKTSQTRLRDRLATADLRLPVLLDTNATHDRDGMQATTGTGGVVHGAARAQLDRAHAQRIIEITGDGDQGLIALQACQAYAKEASHTKYKERPNLDATTSSPAIEPSDNSSSPAKAPAITL